MIDALTTAHVNRSQTQTLLRIAWCMSLLCVYCVTMTRLQSLCDEAQCEREGAAASNCLYVQQHLRSAEVYRSIHASLSTWR